MRAVTDLDSLAEHSLAETARQIRLGLRADASEGRRVCVKNGRFSGRFENIHQWMLQSAFVTPWNAGQPAKAVPPSVLIKELRAFQKRCTFFVHCFY
jgi:hypothetical protein